MATQFDLSTLNWVRQQDFSDPAGGALADRDASNRCVHFMTPAALL